MEEVNYMSHCCGNHKTKLNNNKVKMEEQKKRPTKMSSVFSRLLHKFAGKKKDYKVQAGCH